MSVPLRKGKPIRLPRWYADSKPNAGSRAALYREHQNFNVCYPRVRKFFRHVRRVTETSVPLFFGCIFLHLNAPREGWPRSNIINGVIRLIQHGGIPQPAPLGLVEGLLKVNKEAVPMREPEDNRVGQNVFAIEELFLDFVGTFEDLDSKGRIRALLSVGAARSSGVKTAGGHRSRITLRS